MSPAPPREPVIVPHPNTIRGPIEETYNGLRDAIEKTYVHDKLALEATYHDDIADNQTAKEAALVAAGLNPDGSTPSDYGYPAEDVTLPTITGTTHVGQVLTAHAGTWKGDPDPTFAYQWQRANPDGSSAGDISGATASTYTLVEGDAGKKVRVKVTGTDPFGSASATSVYTVIVGTVPVNTVAPAITGTTTVGEVLTSDAGTWTGSPTPTTAFQWWRANADDTIIGSIPDADEATYTLVSADEGKKVRCTVTATNALGTVAHNSALTAAIAAE